MSSFVIPLRQISFSCLSRTALHWASKRNTCLVLSYHSDRSRFPCLSRSALHWASKRNHSAVVSYLLIHGADKSLCGKDGEVAVQLTTNGEIRNMLGGE